MPQSLPQIADRIQPRILGRARDLPARIAELVCRRAPGSSNRGDSAGPAGKQPSVNLRESRRKIGQGLGTCGVDCGLYARAVLTPDEALKTNTLPTPLMSDTKLTCEGAGQERASLRVALALLVLSNLSFLLAGPALAQSTRTQKTPAAPVASPAEIAEERQNLERARSLLARGNRASAEEAHALLSPLEPRWSGNVEFNYLLGLAALESDKPHEAVFALQRAVAADSGFAGARIELARAYFDAGDNEDARREFNKVAAQKPPPEAARVIHRYLEAIDRRALRYRPGWQARIELGGGYDSNANDGTADSSFLGFDLSDASQETESGFFGVQGQVGYSLPLTPGFGWRASIDGRHREYPDAQFVTQTGGRLRTGLVLSGADWQLASDLSAEALALDGEDNRRVVALDVSGYRTLSASSTGIVSLRAAQLRYDELLEVQDVDQWVGALMLQWRPLAARRWQFQIGPVGGREDARLQGSPFSRDLLGARTEISIVSRGWIWRALFGGLHSDYDDPVFGQTRRDRQLSAQLQLEIPAVFREWTLQPSLAYVDNQSDIALYEYERVEAGLQIQRRW